MPWGDLRIFLQLSERQIFWALVLTLLSLGSGPIFSYFLFHTQNSHEKDCIFDASSEPQFLKNVTIFIFSTKRKLT